MLRTISQNEHIEFLRGRLGLQYTGLNWAEGLKTFGTHQNSNLGFVFHILLWTFMVVSDGVRFDEDIPICK